MHKNKLKGDGREICKAFCPLFFSWSNVSSDLILRKLQGHVRRATNSSPVGAKFKQIHIERWHCKGKIKTEGQDRGLKYFFWVQETAVRVYMKTYSKLLKQATGFVWLIERFICWEKLKILLMNTFFFLSRIFPFADSLAHTTTFCLSSTSHSSPWLSDFFTAKKPLDSRPAFDRNLMWKWYLFKRILSSEIGQRYWKRL